MNDPRLDDVTEAARNIALSWIRIETTTMQIEAAYKRGIEAGASRKELTKKAKKEKKWIRERQKEQVRAREQADEILREMKLAAHSGIDG